MGKIALVLEGGSLRSMFSAGVMDVLMERGLYADGVFGVSAGCLTGVNYVSKQIGRSAKVNLDFVNDRRYMGLRNLMLYHSIFNFDFLFNDISNVYVPFDRETFEKNPAQFTAVSTNCLTGEPVYSEKSSSSDIFAAMRASSSMPLLAPMVELDGVPCLDGGVSVSIPYARPLEEGYDRLLIVTTRDRAFVRQPVSKTIARLYYRVYKNYPQLLRKLMAADTRYAKEQREVNKLELTGKAFVIRPPKPVTVSRTERDKAKLQALYDEGRDECEKRFEDLLSFWNA